MSGVRRKTKYRKGVETDILNSFPEPKDNEEIVRVIGSRGGNLLEVEGKDGVMSLCRLPQRYRRVVWIKRGTLLIAESCAEDFETADGAQGKVKYTVIHVLFTDEQIKHVINLGLMPEKFISTKEPTKKSFEDFTAVTQPERASKSEGDNEEEEDEEEDEEDASLPVNPNRRKFVEESSDEEDAEEEEDE